MLAEQVEVEVEVEDEPLVRDSRTESGLHFDFVQLKVKAFK